MPVCFTGKNEWLEPLAAVSLVLIEPEGGAKMRVTSPPRRAVTAGHTGHRRPMPAADRVLHHCLANGCKADYEASPELIGMEKGHGLVVKGANSQGQAIRYLYGFACALVAWSLAALPIVQVWTY